MKRYIKSNSEELAKHVIEGMFARKAQDVVSMDMRNTDSSICDYFIICSGESNTQVDSIANSVIDEVKNNLNEKALHTEGLENAYWVLVDFGNVVVHVFQQEYRNFYKLEDLWADSQLTVHKDPLAQRESVPTNRR